MILRYDICLACTMLSMPAGAPTKVNKARKVSLLVHLVFAVGAAEEKYTQEHVAMLGDCEQPW